MRRQARHATFAGMGLLVAALAFGFGAMLLIESIPPPWRRAIGGLILLCALIAGIAPEH